MRYATLWVTMLPGSIGRQTRSFLAACRGDAQAAKLLTRRFFCARAA